MPIRCARVAQLFSLQFGHNTVLKPRQRGVLLLRVVVYAVFHNQVIRSPSVMFFFLMALKRGETRFDPSYRCPTMVPKI